MGFLQGDFGELIIKRARQLRFKAKTNGNPWGWSVGGLDDREGVVRADNQRIAAVEGHSNPAILVLARHA